MRLLENRLYQDDLSRVTELPLSWDKLNEKTILISGATGMIGSFLIDVLMNRKDLNVHVYALGRNEEKAKNRFAEYWEDSRFDFIACNINESLDLPQVEKAEFIFHAASNTHPVAYATDPIGTVTTNIIGTNNLLEFGASHGNERFIFASSVEIYGENKGDTELFSEDYLGYIDCNTMRAGYPESKRAGESLCQAYIAQKGMDIVIPRLSRTFGPTILKSDTKAISQFIKKGVAGEDIILKSEGTQLYSYTYVADAVSGVLACLFYGACGEAYNVSDPSCDITLKDLAGVIAEFAGKQVVFEIPDAVESAGYSKATKALLDPKKLNALGWKAHYSMKDGLVRTIQILREENK